MLSTEYRPRQRQLTGLDLGQIEHIVDESQQMLAVRLDPFENLARLLGYRSVDASAEQLRVARRR